MDNVYKLPDYDFETNLWLVYAQSKQGGDWKTKKNIGREYYRIKQSYKKKLKILRCGIAIVDNKNRILCIQGKMTDKWSLPKGHQRHPYEKPITCAQRELYEETGLDLKIPHDARCIKIADQRYFVVHVDNLDTYTFATNDKIEVKDILAIHKDELVAYDTNYGLKNIIMKL